MKSLVKLKRGRHAVWIDPDQVLWCEAGREGTRLHFIDSWDLTVDERPGDVNRLLRRRRQQSSHLRSQSLQEAPPIILRLILARAEADGIQFLGRGAGRRATRQRG